MTWIPKLTRTSFSSTNSTVGRMAPPRGTGKYATFDAVAKAIAKSSGKDVTVLKSVQSASTHDGTVIFLLYDPVWSGEQKGSKDQVSWVDRAGIVQSTTLNHIIQKNDPLAG